MRTIETVQHGDGWWYRLMLSGKPVTDWQFGCQDADDLGYLIWERFGDDWALL